MKNNTIINFDKLYNAILKDFNKCNNGKTVKNKWSFFFDPVDESCEIGICYNGYSLFFEKLKYIPFCIDRLCELAPNVFIKAFKNPYSFINSDEKYLKMQRTGITCEKGDKTCIEFMFSNNPGDKNYIEKTLLDFINLDSEYLKITSIKKNSPVIFNDDNLIEIKALVCPIFIKD